MTEDNDKLLISSAALRQHLFVQRVLLTDTICSDLPTLLDDNEGLNWKICWSHVDTTNLTPPAGLDFTIQYNLIYSRHLHNKGGVYV